MREQIKKLKNKEVYGIFYPMEKQWKKKLNYYHLRICVLVTTFYKVES